MLFPSLILLAAIVILYFGAEFSLEASELVGKRLGMSPLMIGMLLVGFGTSLPEFFVGHIAGTQGKFGIAVGSLLGSNIANLFLILGLTALMTKMRLNNKSLQSQLYFHLALGLVLWFVLTRESLNLINASPLIILCIGYLYSLIKDFKANDGKNIEPVIISSMVILKLFLGFGMLYLGGELLVSSGSKLCIALGISEYIVSAIFIAFGTSFPELVTSFLAAYKKKDTDLIVGNIVGSNLFNCAFILGSLGVYEFRLLDSYFYEIISLIVGAGVLIILSLAGKSMFRKTGILFLLCYTAIVGHWLNIL